VAKKKRATRQGIVFSIGSFFGEKEEGMGLSIGLYRSKRNTMKKG